MKKEFNLSGFIVEKMEDAAGQDYFLSITIEGVECDVQHSTTRLLTIRESKELLWALKRMIFNNEE